MEGRQLRWFARFEIEHDNLRAALAWSVSADDGAEVGLRLASAIERYWDVGGYWGEGRQWWDDAAFAAAHADGRAMSFDQAVVYALETPGSRDTSSRRQSRARRRDARLE